MTTEKVAKLRETIRELESELAQAESLDAHTQAALREAVEQVQAALQAGELEPQETETLIGQLEHAESRFQAEHPTLSGLVIRIIDALGQLGI